MRRLSLLTALPSALFALLITICLWPPLALGSAPPLAPLTAQKLRGMFPASQVTVVNLWATWCAPCKVEMPELLGLKLNRSERELQLILVDGDQGDDAKEVSAFLDQLKVGFQTFVVAEPPDKFMAAFEKNWPATVPTTMVFDSTGKRLAYMIGRVDIKILRTRVEKALKNGPKDAASKPKAAKSN